MASKASITAGSTAAFAAIPESSFRSRLTVSSVGPALGGAFLIDLSSPYFSSNTQQPDRDSNFPAVSFYLHLASPATRSAAPSMSTNDPWSISLYAQQSATPVSIKNKL